MDEQVAEGIAAFAAIGMLTVFLIYVAWIVLLIIARWKIFTKAGEKGWKSLIPIYSDYVEWRIAWKKLGLFWVYLGLVVVGLFLFGLSGTYTVDPTTGAYVATEAGNMVLAGIGSILVLAALVLTLVETYKLMVSFGHGIGWTILYIFFSSIVLLVLGFGSSQYQGAQD